MEEKILALADLSEQNKPSQRSMAVIRKWLTELAMEYDYTVTQENAIVLCQVWARRLVDLSPEQIQAAFEKLEKCFEPTAACRFPMPVHLLKHVEEATHAQSEESAESSWHDTMRAIERQYHPDISWRGPRLPDRADRSLRAAGGEHYVANCPETDLIWAKKRFIEEWLRSEVLERDGNLLPMNEVDPRLRGALQELAERKSVVSPQTATVGGNRGLRGEPSREAIEGAVDQESAARSEVSSTRSSA